MQHIGLSLLTAGAALLSVTPSVHAADKKPNILVIWGDDIGTWNISHNNRGMMGYSTPNIDRVARKAWPSPITTRSRAALQDVRLSSVARCRYAQV